MTIFSALRDQPTALPAPIIIDPSSVTSLRWGVMGPGWISSVFTASTLKHTSQRIVAVGSTSAERAKSFAERFNLPRWYGSYEDLLADPAIDAVYIGTRQHVHRDNVLQALAAGKHVVVEKPLTTLVQDARAIREAARESGLFVMEAMWTTYLPQSSIIRQLKEDNVLGDIRLIHADLGQDLRDQPRLFDIHGGGASHDLGIYPTAFVSSLLDGAPEEIQATGTLLENGLDAELSTHLAYSGGANAYTFASMINFSPQSAWVDGTLGTLSISSPFPIPATLNLLTREFVPQVVASWTDRTGVVGHEGLSYQATAVAHFLDQGLTESPWRNLDASVKDIETITRARQQIGALYPGESA